MAALDKKTIVRGSRLCHQDPEKGRVGLKTGQRRDSSIVPLITSFLKGGWSDRTAGLTDNRGNREDFTI